MSRIFDITSPINTEMRLESEPNFQMDIMSILEKAIVSLFSDITLILHLTSELELEDTE
jgi:hypothetical protein